MEEEVDKFGGVRGERAIQEPTAIARKPPISMVEESECSESAPKKINTNVKGGNIERAIRDVLRERGYEIEKAYRKAMWIKGKVISQPNDFFGCMDLIAIKKDSLKFVQSTVKGKQSGKFEEILGHNWPSFADVEIWTWYGGRKSKDMKFDGTGKCKVVKAQGWDVWRLNHKLWKFENVGWVDSA